jgi:hypothetical protein
MNKPIPNYDPATDGDHSGFLVHAGDDSFEVDGDTPFAYVMEKLEDAASTHGSATIEIFRIACDGGICADAVISTTIERQGP